MRMNSHGIPGRLIALATLLALVLTFLFAGGANASTVAASPQISSNALLCISATPPNQIVGVRETAWVTVTVNCPPVAAPTYVRVTWGDGTIEYYPLACQQICHTPPFVIATSHAYTSTGDYHPVFCLIPSSVSTSPDCTTVQIIVVILDPPSS